jgi:hypothetical protein
VEVQLQHNLLQSAMNKTKISQKKQPKAVKYLNSDKNSQFSRLQALTFIRPTGNDPSTAANCSGRGGRGCELSSDGAE